MRLASTQPNPDDGEESSRNLYSNYKDKYATDQLVSAGYGIYPVRRTTASSFSIYSFAPKDNHQTSTQSPSGRK
jgi:hypothetical protein